MDTANNPHYHWQNRLNTLVFEFAFTGPEEMTVCVYALHGNNLGSVMRDSFRGTVSFTDALIGGLPLNGDLWMEPGKNNVVHIRADLAYGLEPSEQELEVTMLHWAQPLELKK